MRSRGCRSARGGRREAVGGVREWSWSERRVGGRWGSWKMEKGGSGTVCGLGTAAARAAIGISGEREGRAARARPPLWLWRTTSTANLPDPVRTSRDGCGRGPRPILLIRYFHHCPQRAMRQPAARQGAICRPRKRRASPCMRSQVKSPGGSLPRDLRIGYSRKARSTSARRGAVHVPLSPGLPPSPSLETAHAYFGPCWSALHYRRRWSYSTLENSSCPAAAAETER
jgi:hypothetical protein